MPTFILRRMAAQCLTPAIRTIYQNMQKLKLDVEQHVPIHRRPGTNEEFLKIMGKSQ
jgi:hypothetical protein